MLYQNMDSFGHPTNTKTIKDFNEKAQLEKSDKNLESQGKEKTN